MKTVGIVAEWNPFHNGHARLIFQARCDYPDACIVSVMSGSFCQRGEISIFDKWTRTDMALAGGIDLVLELPQIYATSSLEGFARGGIASLLALHSIDFLYCGSESGDVSFINRQASYLKENKADFDQWMRHCLANGESYASACQRFLQNGMDSSSNFTLGPNDRLALQYRWAMPDSAELKLVKRIVAHDAHSPEANQLSGSAIREGLKNCSKDIWQYLPATSKAVLENSSSSPNLTYHDHLLNSLKIYACSHSADELALQLRIQDGWTPRFLKAIKQASTFKQLLDIAQTRQYSRSRIQRLCVELLVPSPVIPSAPSYTRILGASARGRSYLSEITATTPLVLNVGKDKRKLSPEAQILLQHDINRQNLADQLCHHPIFDRDYYEPPRMKS